MSAVEVLYYLTPGKGTKMVLCPCRCKVRVLNDGTLQRHWAYDEDYGEDVAGYCLYSGGTFTEKEGEVFGYSGGVLEPPPLA